MPGKGMAQSRGVEVRTVSPLLIDAQPGGIVSLSFQVTNTSGSTEEFIEHLQLPAEWQEIIPTGVLELTPSERRVRIAAVQVPISAPAGRYEITYSVRSQRDYAIQDAFTVSVVVLPVMKLSLMIEDKPDTVIAGDEYQARVRVINRSNTPLDVSLQIENTNPLYPAKIEPNRLSLAPGGSEVVTVTAGTNKKEGRSFKNFLNVKAFATTSNNKRISTSLPISTEIIPRVTSDSGLKHTVHSDLTYRVAGTKEQAGVQVSWKGAGTLDEAGTKHVDFLFQGPDKQVKGIYGYRDEYRLNYYDKNIDVRLGDQTYGLSYLTDNLHYGRGLGINLRSSTNTDTGLYYVASRWSNPGEETGGAYIRQRINDKLSMKLNLLYNREDSDFPAGTDSRLWSLEAAIRPSDTMSMHLEYAKSYGEKPDQITDDAYRLELNGKLGSGAYYSLQRTYAGPDFMGSYQDRDYNLGSVTLPIGSRLQANASFSTWRQNLDMKPGQNASPKENLMQFSLRCQLPENYFASVGYDSFHRRDVMNTNNFDFKENPVRMDVGRSLGNYAWRFEYRNSEQENQITQQTTSVRDCRLYTSYRPNSKQFYTLYTGYRSSGQKGYLLGGGNHIGASVSLIPSDNLSLSAWYTNYNTKGDQGNSHQAALSARYITPDGKSISGRMLYNYPSSIAKGISYELLYTIPLDIAVGKKTSVGLIRGRVFDTQKDGKPGISDVLLTLNGTAAVTDKDGRFIFPAIAPGKYSLNVDRKSIGLSRIPAEKSPFVVEITGGDTTKVEIGVLSAASLSGIVRLCSNNSSNQPSDASLPGNTTSDGKSIYIVGNPKAQENERGLGNTLVELTDGSEILRRATDSNGEFLFESLRPGKWQLKISDYNLPAYHYIENPEREFELESGGQEKVTVRVLPRLRQIKMIEQGDMITSK